MLLKTTGVLAIFCTVLGFPWAVLVWLSGAMKSVPGLDGNDLQMSLPLPLAAVVLGGISVGLALIADPKRKNWAWAAGIAAGISLLTMVVLIATYYEMQRVRLL